jgi:hypothetical protein
MHLFSIFETVASSYKYILFHQAGLFVFIVTKSVNRYRRKTTESPSQTFTCCQSVAYSLETMDKMDLMDSNSPKLQKLWTLWNLFHCVDKYASNFESVDTMESMEIIEFHRY